MFIGLGGVAVVGAELIERGAGDYARLDELAGLDDEVLAAAVDVEGFGVDFGGSADLGLRGSEGTGGVSGAGAGDAEDARKRPDRSAEVDCGDDPGAVVEHALDY